MLMEVKVMKWVVDRIEAKIAILENIETLEKREVAVTLLPSFLHEGAILVYQDNNYKIDMNEEVRRRKELEDRFKRLRNNT